MKTNTKKTIVFFHTGRGGHFYNGGHVTFCGEKNIQDVANLQCDKLFGKNRDENGRFCTPHLADYNGHFMISLKDLESGIGYLDWDGDYNTDECLYLADCDKSKILIIAEQAEKYEWEAEEIIKAFFEECTDLKVDWTKFDGRFESLVEDWFETPTADIDLDNYYELEGVADGE